MFQLKFDQEKAMTQIRVMTIDDHERILNFLKQTPGVTLRVADEYDPTKCYLERNPGLSFVAEQDGSIIGCLMAGHDGRRGYLQHLIVDPDYRNQGIAKRLVKNTVKELSQIGINKCHVFSFKTNTLGNGFWKNIGWQQRNDVNMYSLIPSANPDA